MCKNKDRYEDILSAMGRSCGQVLCDIKNHVKVVIFGNKISLVELDGNTRSCD